MTMMQMPSHSDDRELLLGHQIDDLLLRLRGLLLVRDVLAERGASAEEIGAHAEEAERVRVQLAELIGGRVDDPEFGAAA